MDLKAIVDGFWIVGEREELLTSLQSVVDETVKKERVVSEEEMGLVISTLERALKVVSGLDEGQIRLMKGLVMVLRNVSVVCGCERGVLLDVKSVLARTGLCFAQYEGVHAKHGAQLAALSAMSVLNFPQLLGFACDGVVYDLDAFRALALLVNDHGLESVNVGALAHLLPLYFDAHHEELRVDVFYRGKDEVTMLLVALCRASGIAPGVDLDSFMEVEEPKRTVRMLLVRLVSQLATHESFGGILCRIERGIYVGLPGEDAKGASIPLIYLTQLICEANVTSTDHDHLDMISLAAWTLEYFGLVSEQAKELLAKETLSDSEQDSLGRLHRKVIAVLDIMATHVELNVVVRAFDEYGLLSKLLGLFHVVEANTLKPRLKDKISAVPGQMVSGKKQFPGVKSIAIELVTALVHFNKANQDVVRENTGLELVLNNCNLDMNEPFIKERAILCLRYLLEGNAANQRFIASLEARGAEQSQETEEALHKAGYEVEVVDGRVRLKPSAARAELESKVL